MTEAEGLAFERTARAIRDDVTSGVLTPDDRVPSEVELRERCGVSMPTVTCAVALLKAWGVVETQVGSGTRVVDPARGVQVSGPDEHTERMRRGRPIYASGERSAIYAAGVVSSAAACQVSGQIRSRRWHVAVGAIDLWLQRTGARPVGRRARARDHDLVTMSSQRFHLS